MWGAHVPGVNVVVCIQSGCQVCVGGGLYWMMCGLCFPVLDVRMGGVYSPPLNVFFYAGVYDLQYIFTVPCTCTIYVNVISNLSWAVKIFSTNAKKKYFLGGIL